MARFELKLPKMGESVAEATITSWLKDVGDSVELDEAVVEIATDKVDSEVPSEVEGTLVEILFQKDDVVAVGDTIAIIETEGENDVEEQTATKNEKTVATEEVKEVEKTIEKASEIIATPLAKNSDSGKFYSPLVRNIAQTEGVSMEELETL
ncbi:MAG: biotin/lipoyl-containing protein, partial [Polaribacter sp.]|uniref:biotin/lipoyl-containing protein n=1 Tax=Polaribacter sp. TaxID=1920175 RepID=UPI0032194E1F